ncbi:HlyD family efflux transporter periplasmic adaptor subunit [Desulfofundulus sp. TPOSR]|uniref:efflux RND transporter periplasmic adaptor subunit n=1 Tax=Desulfofundulus sp. TPOSR TaxID=2714340 RepID=UPI0028BEB2FB|nr:HlyD family efflux transporter periplasmic adaptor subunit [Desulfofundulus sp. TPOSR]
MEGGVVTIISEALQVRAQVNEADIGRLKVGQKAEFTVNSFPNKTFTGRVSSISPQAYTESNVQLYDAVIQLDKNQDGLMAGMPANVNIIVDRHENVLTVPKSAVTYAISYLNKMRQGGAPGQRPSGSDSGGGRTGGAGAGGAGSTRGGGNETGTSGAAGTNEQGQQAVVLVLDKSGKPAPRRVVLGLADLTSYEVLEGLEEGDLVVIGSLDQQTGSTSSRGGSMPFMPGGMPPGGGGGGRR